MAVNKKKDVTNIDTRVWRLRKKKIGLHIIMRHTSHELAAQTIHLSRLNYLIKRFDRVLLCFRLAELNS